MSAEEDLFSQMAEDAANSGPADSQLRLVARLARRQRELERKVERAEALLAGRQKQLTEVQRRLLPEALREAGLKDFTLDGGGKVSVKDEYYATISGPNREAALTWLRERGHDGIIKNSVEIKFGRGEDTRAAEAMALLAEHGFSPTQTEKVEPQTLKATAKDLRLDQDPEAKAIFGVYVDRVAKVK